MWLKIKYSSIQYILKSMPPIYDKRYQLCFLSHTISNRPSHSRSLSHHSNPQLKSDSYPTEQKTMLSLSLCSLMQQVMQYNNADIDEDKDIEKSLHIFPKKHMKVILAMEMLLEMATDIIPIGLYYSIYMPIKKKKSNHHWQVSLISLFDRNVGAVKLGVDNKYVLVLGRTTYNIFHDNSSRSNVTSLPAA